MSSWQSIGWFGTFYPTSERPWWNQPVWDTCGCCSDDINSNRFFGLMNALFGYQVRLRPAKYQIETDWIAGGPVKNLTDTCCGIGMY